MFALQNMWHQASIKTQKNVMMVVNLLIGRGDYNVLQLEKGHLALEKKVRA